MAEEGKERAPDRAERLIVEGILGGIYPAGSELPGERYLSAALGVARPALREALARLDQGGWLLIQQGKPTRVNDPRQDGNLHTLIRMLESDLALLPDLLELWELVAPTYTRHAIDRDPRAVLRLLAEFREIDEQPGPMARAQWRLHRLLIELSGNPIYGLILNSFRDFYTRMTRHFFGTPAERDHLRHFWSMLEEAAAAGDSAGAASAMAEYMALVKRLWEGNEALKQ